MRITKAILSIGLSLSKKAGKNIYKNNEFDIENSDNDPDGSFYGDAYISDSEESPEKKYVSQTGLSDDDWEKIYFDQTKNDFFGEEYYNADIGQYEPYDKDTGGYELDQSKIKEYEDILDDSLNIVVGYLFKLEKLVSKFKSVKSNNSLENEHFLNRIDNFIKKLNNINKQFEAASGMDQVDSIEKRMDALKDFFEDMKALHEIMGFEDAGMSRPVDSLVVDLRNFLVAVRTLTEKNIYALNEKIEEFDDMDLVKKIYLSNKNRPIGSQKDPELAKEMENLRKKYDGRKPETFYY